MSKGKGGSDGRTPASGLISVPKPSVYRVTNNWRGDVGEAAFAYKAMRLGYALSKPLGNIQRYDYVVEGSGKLWRVQVKTTAHMEAGLYSLHTRCFTQQRLGAYKRWILISWWLLSCLRIPATYFPLAWWPGARALCCVPRSSSARGTFTGTLTHAI